MKINKSSADCKAHNDLNAAAIESGLMEGWEPTDETLQREQKQAAYEAAEAAKAVKIKAVYQTILNALPQDLRDAFKEGKRHLPYIGVELFQAYDSRGFSRSGNAYWRVVVSYFGEGKKFFKLPALQEPEPKQMTKIVAAVLDANATMVAQAQRQQRENDARTYKDNVFKAHKSTWTKFGLWEVEPRDGGKVYAKVGVTLTPAQFEELHAWLAARK
jgi:hypothetical protein